MKSVVIFNDMKNHALAAFRKPPEQLNCAQSVLYGYQQVTGDTGISIASLKPFGGGRAPEGLCGAIYSACLVAPDAANDLKENFSKVIGSAFCRQIREANRHSCDVCVSRASELLEARIHPTQH
jgi:hypothetical protein